MTLQKENKTVKDYTITMRIGTTVVLAVAIITSLFGAGIAYQKICGQLDSLTVKAAIYAREFESLEDRVDSNDIQFAEIKKDVANININILNLLKVYRNGVIGEN